MDIWYFSPVLNMVGVVSTEIAARILAEKYPDTIYFFAELVPPELALPDICVFCHKRMDLHIVHNVQVAGEWRPTGWLCP